MNRIEWNSDTETCRLCMEKMDGAMCGRDWNVQDCINCLCDIIDEYDNAYEERMRDINYVSGVLHTERKQMDLLIKILDKMRGFMSTLFVLIIGYEPQNLVRHEMLDLKKLIEEYDWKYKEIRCKKCGKVISDDHVRLTNFETKEATCMGCEGK